LDEDYFAAPHGGLHHHENGRRGDIRPYTGFYTIYLVRSERDEGRGQGCDQLINDVEMEMHIRMNHRISRYPSQKDIEVSFFDTQSANRTCAREFYVLALR